MSLFAERAREARDGLIVLARDANSRGIEIPDVVKELVAELHAQALAAERVSELGSRQVPAETIDGVRTWGTPDEAGESVGLTGRRVRQLCADGQVMHRRVGAGRYLVDLDDLQRHLGRSA